MSVFEISRQVHAPRRLVWPVIADVEHYADFAPNLSSAHVVEGSGLGMTRSCSNLDGQPWKEECVLWEEGHRYAFRVDTSDYPYPLRKMQGTWTVEEAGESSVVSMRFEYEMKFGLIGRAIAPFLRPVFKRTCVELLDNWERKINESTREAMRREVEGA